MINLFSGVQAEQQQKQSKCETKVREREFAYRRFHKGLPFFGEVVEYRTHHVKITKLW